MTITPNTLIRGAGAAAVAAGVTFIGIQIGHPHLDADSITTTEMTVRGSLKVLMTVLSLLGITGMYLSQVRRNGLLGLVGYVVSAVGYVSIMATSFVSAYVLPKVVGADREYVSSAIDTATGGQPSTDLGVLELVLKGQGFTYLAGGLILGTALYRAGVLTRWACALLAVGGLVSAALSVLPDAFYRLLAYPTGIAMIALGYSLWRTTRATTPLDTSSARSAQRVTTAVAQ